MSFSINRDMKQWVPCLDVNGSNGETKKKQILDYFVRKKNPPEFMISQTYFKFDQMLLWETIKSDNL